MARLLNIDPSEEAKLESHRNVVLMAPFASLEHPNAKLLFRLYKAVNPDDARGALAEWCRRMPGSCAGSLAVFG